MSFSARILNKVTKKFFRRVDEEEGAFLTHHHDAIGNLVETSALE